MGSGKSTVGAAVAAAAGAVHHDLDAMIEDRAGASVGDLFRTRGEAGFRGLEAAALPAALEPGSVVSTGGGTPLLDRSWALLRERAFTVWLDAPFGVLLERARREGARPLLEGRAEAELAGLLAARRARYAEAEARVDAAGPAAEVAGEVLRLWRE